MQNLTLHSILSPTVFTVAPDTPLPDVLASMESLRISCVVAIDNKQQPLGIFTEQDAIRLMAERKIASQLRMSDEMSSPPLTAPADMGFREAYRLISEHGYRHLIVVNQTGRLVGIISEADFLHHMGMEYLVELKTVGNTMTHDLVSLKEDATLADAVDLMSKYKTSCVIVTRDQKPVGILTERDSVALARTTIDPARINIVRVMKTPVQTIEASLPVQAAMQQMEATGIRHLVVVDGEILTGIVTRHDIVKSIQGRYLEFLHETLERQRKDLRQLHKQIKQARQQLLYQGLIEQVNEAIIVFEAESGSIVDCNDQACRDLDYTRDELLSLSIFDFTTRIKPGPSWQAELDIFIRDGLRKVETLHRRRDGSLFPVEINARLIDKGKERYIVTVARDLSESKRAAAQLLLQSTALNTTANAIVITDKSGAIQWTNPAFSELTGFASDEVLGKHPKDLVRSGLHPHEFYESLWNTILSGEAWHGEIINKRKDGTLYTEEMTITPVCAEGNAITHFIAVKQDISERKQQEMMQDARSKMLEQIATSQPLDEILRTAVRNLEWIFPHMRASVLLLDPKSGRLGQGIAPSLPDFYYEATEGVQIGPNAGSCGTSAYTGETVVVENIQTHDYWRDCRDLAERAGIRACTSIPFKNEAGQVLGTFAVYFAKPQAPTPRELVLLHDFSRMVGMAIDKEQNHLQRAEAEKLLRSSEEKYRNLVECAPFPVIITDTESGTVEFCNSQAEALFGISLSQVKGVKAANFYANPADRDRIIASRLAGEIAREEELELLTAGGDRIWVLQTAANIMFDGRPSYISSLVNITSRKLAELQLREAAVVMQSTHEGVVITDTAPRIIAINDAYTTITGYTTEEALGKNPSILSSGQHGKSFYQAMWKDLLENGHWQGELCSRRKNGEIFPQWLSISAIRNEQQQTVRYIGVFSDISKLKESQSKLEFLAHHDPLTELFNRSSVEARMEQELMQAQQRKQQLAVLFIDLDRFKQVNDSFGHLLGDELLCNVAERLKKCARPGDTLGRLGGDEFVLLTAPLQEKYEAKLIARNILKALAEPFILSNGVEVFIGGSIGISLSPDHGLTVAEMTRNADAAMYQAKESGRNQFSMYTSELNADARQKLEMENDLRRAVLHQELRLHYQPKMDLQTGKICGAEALARWQKPDGHWIPPAQFIPLAEKSGLILNIGEWVLEQACSQIRLWLNDGLLDVCVAVNIPARQFRSGNLDKLVRSVLDKHKIPPHLLELELTESMLMQEPEHAIETMQKLKKTGVKLALDDFGTGYSNFAYLRRFPIDSLKIDQSFVRGIATKEEDAMIVDAIIGLAQRMQLRVVAEGVETAAQLAYIRSKHCDELQGHYFSKALPAAEFAKLLRSAKKMAI